MIRTLTIVTAAILLTSCTNTLVDSSARILPEEPAIYTLSKKIELSKASFETNVPSRALSRFKILSPTNGVDATLLIDSSEDRLFFPFLERRRKFSSLQEVSSFIGKIFGGRAITDDSENTAIGYRGSYIWKGAAYFVDPHRDTAYRVTDPVIAYLGSVHGIIEIDGEEICVDPDGKCSDSYASYLEPVSEPTAPSFLLHCGREHEGTPVCVQHHTFFNKASFLFGSWARHGANVGFTYFAPLPSTRLSAGGSIVLPTGITTFSMPTVQNTAQGSIETAMWCLIFGSGSCVELEATAACGVTSVSDPDVNGVRRTGNGPSNNSFCP